MPTSEIAIPAWVRSRRARWGAAAALLFFGGVAVGGAGDAPVTSAPTSALAALPAQTVTVPGPTVVTTVVGAGEVTEVPGPTVTVVKTKQVRVTKTVRVTQRAVAPVPLVDVPDEDTSAYYDNCSAARAAGAAPVRRGDPGYGRHLDRDGDGVGCEG